VSLHFISSNEINETLTIFNRHAARSSNTEARNY